MQDHSTIAVAEIAQHAEWCWPGNCEIAKDEDGLFHGRHFGDQRQGAFSWDEIAVSISAPDVDLWDGAPDEPMIALRFAEGTYLQGVTEENKWRLGQTKLIQPEEAEMLARWLLKAVDEWREATKPSTATLRGGHHADSR